MKEKKTVYDHEWNNTTTLDSLGQWFYGLFGWHYVKTSSYEESHAVEKNYLVSDGKGRVSIEKGYEDIGSTYDVWHTFERDTNDPKYSRYCELERRMCTVVDMWKRYASVESILESVCPKGVPRNYNKYKKRFVSFYVWSAVILGFMGFMLLVYGGDLVGNWKSFSIEDRAYSIMFLALLGCPGVALLISGIAKHLKSLNEKKTVREYRAYVAGMLSGKENPTFCRIVKDAVELQIEL